MSRFSVDFEIYGQIEVEAASKEEAKEKVEAMSTEQLSEHTNGINVGKNYIVEEE